MSWLITPQQKTLNGTLTLGQELQGGFFAGYISHTADGNPTHALIVAPRATGATGTSYTLTTSLAWAASGSGPDTTGITAIRNQFDGAVNIQAMQNYCTANSLTYSTTFPAASFCTALSIGGHNDWYLPSKSELEIAYFNLKPSTQDNNTVSGINAYSVPPRDLSYTTSLPMLTVLTEFRTPSGSQAFVEANHWSSTDATATGSWAWGFGTGQENGNGKANPLRVRAFRKIAL